MSYTFYKDGKIYFRKDNHTGELLQVKVSEDKSHLLTSVTSPIEIPDSAKEVSSVPNCARKEFAHTANF